MRTKLLNKKGLILTILSIICAVFIAFATAATGVFRVDAATETITITGIQVRSNGSGNGYDFIVLQASEYSSVVADTSVSDAANYNTRSKVKIYTSATDSEGKYLTEICGTWWTQNLWGSGGLMLAVNDYSTYNGATIYKITIESGCPIPCGDKVYETAETFSLTNDNFGESANVNGAFNWTRVTSNLGTATLSGVQVRSAGGTENFIVLLSDVYDATPSGKPAISSFNTRDKIKVYTSATDSTEKSLSAFIGGWYEYAYWGQHGLFMAYNTPSDYDTYNGKTIYKIVIEAGCQLPYGAYGYYTTSETYTFYNTEFGDSDVKNGAFKWDTVSSFETSVSLTGVQMRGAINGWYYYLVLRSDSYSGRTSTEGIDGATDKTAYGYDKIRLYTSMDDATGKPLSELTLQHTGCNQWGESGLFINFAEYDSTYGGHQVYKITVEKGCILPSGDGKFFVVDNDYSYTNDDFENEDKKLSAYRWVGSRGTAEFIADGKAVATRYFIYGEETVISDLPAVPAKDGYTAVKWQDYSLDDIHKTIYAEYLMGYAYGRSISLDGEISINFYIRLLDDNATVTLTPAEGEALTVKCSDSDVKTIDGIEYRVFSYSLVAKEYDAVVTLAIIPSNTEQKGIVVSSSIKEYAEQTIADDTADEKLKNLAQSLINYCSAAKSYFGGDTVTAYTGSTVALENYKPTAEGTVPDGVTLNGASLVLESMTEIKVYFSGANASGVACTVNGKTVTQQQEGDYFVITINNIAAQNLSDFYEIAIGGMTIRYSALSYAYAVTSNTSETDTNLVNLVKYLYDYNVKAKLFF